MPRRKREIDPRTTLTKRQTEKCRLAIKSTQIINRLQDNFEGKLPEPLTPSQLKAAELLLSRSVPTLTAMEVTQPEYDPGPESPLELERQFMQMAREYLQKLPDEEKQELLSGNVIEFKQA